MEDGTPSLLDDKKRTSKIARLSLLSLFNRFGFALNSIALPLFALAIGQDEAFYGVMVAAAGYVQAIALFPAGTLSDRKGRGAAILFGGIVNGACLFYLPFVTDSLMIIIVYALTGVGSGFTRTSLDSLIADHTKKGNERTKSYGITIAVATLAASTGPFLAGFIIDPVAFPLAADPLFRYAILFYIMGSFRLAAGIFGFFTERWLHDNPDITPAIVEEAEEEPDDSQELNGNSRDDLITAILFGTSQAMMGISSGMVVPFLIPWIYAAFNPDPIILGSVPAVANLTLASGTLFVGLQSERVGKIKMIFLLYLLTPLLTIGMVYIPIFLVMVGFYVIRMAVANMARPASNSLFMGEISSERRARSLALTRVMWTFPRQTGTLLTSYLLSIGIMGGIVNFGRFFFPIAFMLYPVCVIPMYLAVRRNKRIVEQRRQQRELTDSVEVP
ncbi:MAG: Multidrug resistance protein MdtG [Candidatus Thorarchaeota archaeon]|nr:MAG: Multidrug resistance protein MdtG [Candidatus Thorarchaeota archaeon]